ncbi:MULTISPECIES: hypothetical protein [Nostoc]|uniref:Uncharacterized protein n=1 Tax=Nostoc paludosum FACHB-159 TaxID=2692908 RepID=A0ABR8K4H4_9NOSO|nr:MULTISPECIES: hypothetical protein [Nostoc]MBD2677083.1 hypothetical protein [Nostoc sp. FACHB-857]MBD2733283.1 hypothetical protein [Nostoc paludosum FACHB-159]
MIKFKITVIEVKSTIKITGNKVQFQQKSILKETWWLMSSSFPNLNWARLRTYDDLSAEILDCDGSKYTFSNEEEARYFLMEDEFTQFESLDREDEQEIGISLSLVDIPKGKNERELIEKMYVKQTEIRNEH